MIVFFSVLMAQFQTPTLPGTKNMQHFQVQNKMKQNHEHLSSDSSNDDAS